VNQAAAEDLGLDGVGVDVADVEILEVWERI